MIFRLVLQGVLIWLVNRLLFYSQTIMLDKNMEHMCMCPTIYGGWTSRLCPGVEDHAVAVNKKTVTAEQIIEVGTQVVFCSSSTNQETTLPVNGTVPGMPSLHCNHFGNRTMINTLPDLGERR